MTVPSSFRVLEGSSDSGVILHVPHASRHIPASVRADLLLTEEELARELDRVTDSLTDVMALESASAARLRPWLFVNDLSRLVIDPERLPDAREVMERVGQGPVYMTTSQGAVLRRKDDARRQDLMTEYFHPYASALADLVEERVGAVGGATILDIHSYRVQPHPNDLNHGHSRPLVCLGTDAFHTPPALRALVAHAFSSIGDVLDNEPYAGTYVPLRLYDRSTAVASIMLELRADTHVDEQLRPTEGFPNVVAALTSVIDGLAPQ